MRDTAVFIVAASVLTPDMTASYLGVPVNVLVACTAGAYCSFSFGDKVEPRSRMFQLFFACIIMGCAVTALSIGALQHWVTTAPIPDTVQAGIGAVVAFATRFFWPPVVDGLRHGRWIEWLPFVKKKEDGK